MAGAQRRFDSFERNIGQAGMLGKRFAYPPPSIASRVRSQLACNDLGAARDRLVEPRELVP